ncbi:hypothetical protein FDP41_011434 [Naegleria fowleri]|uniref:Uncharacterized protein n=1 Tax=Naegleria fowleri TaxID=5763 RepID=A0A6A5C7N6_NAEFO|nr:uncharacterized protein FDP41_011434 [Naegleria fowleri]KAF0982504.1 hypothetical protein FDP41_011434 [Naegleria fowleri]
MKRQQQQQPSNYAQIPNQTNTTMNIIRHGHHHQHHHHQHQQHFLLCQYFNHLNTLLRYSSHHHFDSNRNNNNPNPNNKNINNNLNTTTTTTTTRTTTTTPPPLRIQVSIESNHGDKWSGDFESVDEHLNMELTNVEYSLCGVYSSSSSSSNRMRNVSTRIKMINTHNASHHVHNSEFSHLRLSGKFIKYIAVMNMNEIISHLNNNHNNDMNPITTFESNNNTTSNDHYEPIGRDSCGEVSQVFNKKLQILNYYSAQSKRKKKKTSHQQRPARKIIVSDLAIVRDF